MNIHDLQHVPFESLGCIETWAKLQGHAVTSTRLYLNQSAPSLDTVRAKGTDAKQPADMYF